MSHIADILTAVKSSLVDQSSFLTADIYKRNPIEEEYDHSKVNLFVYPETIEPYEQPFVTDFRVYKIAIVCKFIVDGRSNSVTATDSVTVNKGTYADEIMDAMQDCLPNGIHSIANVYQVDLISTDLNFGEEGIPYLEMTATEYAIKQVYSFFTYESNTFLLGYDGATYFLAYDGSTKLITY